MMGPISFDPRFSPGTLVIVDPGTSVYNKHRDSFGTIVDNFVDIEIKTGKRTEKVLVMWPDSSTNWLYLHHVMLVPKD